MREFAARAASLAEKNSMNILVTGSDGYIGSGLVVKLLAEGHTVHCVDKKIFYNLEFGRREKYHTPVRRHQRRHRYASEAHSAYHPSGRDQQRSGRRTGFPPDLGTNVLYTLLLIDKAVRAGVPQFTFASSGSVYGLKEEERVTEEMELVPLTDYNKSKMCAERILLSYRNKIGVTIIRPRRCAAFRRASDWTWW